MQILVEVMMSPEEYTRRYEEIEWPVLEVCPVCGAHARLQGHGSYLRNGLPSKETELVVMVHRLLCPVCRKTVSLLPSFLLPYFQYTARFIVESLLGKAMSYRELLRFHWRRFLVNANRVLAVLRDLGMKERLPEGEKDKAMKLLGSIEDSGLERVTEHEREGVQGTTDTVGRDVPEVSPVRLRLLSRQGLDRVVHSGPPRSDKRQVPPDSTLGIVVRRRRQESGAVLSWAGECA